MRKRIQIIAFLLLLIFSACDYWKWELEAVRPPHPQLTKIEPPIARHGSVISLKGMFFCPGDTLLHEVVFPGGISVQPLSVPTADSMLVKVPKGAGCGQLMVRYKGFEQEDYDQHENSPDPNSPDFTYELTPVSVEDFAGRLKNTDCTNCLNQPAGLAVDEEGNVWVADKGNHVIRKISPGGSFLKTIGGKGLQGCNDDPDSRFARFRSPTDVTIDNQGRIYVADSRSFTVRRIESTGDHRVCTIAGKCDESGSDDNVPGLEARFEGPIRITTDGNDFLYLADQKNGKSRISKIQLDNACEGIDHWWTSTFVCYGFSELGYLFTVWGVDFMPAAGDYPERVLATDGGLNKIYSFDANSGLPTLLKETGLSDPRDIDADEKGNIYIADTDNQIIKVLSARGIMSDLAGSGARGHVNGDPSTARFDGPEGLAFDKQNNILYVSDTENHLIRKIKLE